MNDQNTMFGYTPPMEKREKSNVDQLILMNAQFLNIYSVLHKEYNLFIQNTKSCLEQ